MTQAEILATEKFRQNKHLINRIRLKRRNPLKKHHERRYQDIKNNGDMHIAKFFEKGIPLKTPLLPRHTMMTFVPSLAPPGSGLSSRNNSSRSFQVLNTSRDNNHGHNNGNIIFPSSPALPISSTGSNKFLSLSPNPSITSSNH